MKSFTLLVVLIMASLTWAHTFENPVIFKREREEELVPDNPMCKLEWYNVVVKGCLVDHLSEENIHDVCENYKTNCESSIKKLKNDYQCFKDQNQENFFQALVGNVLISMNLYCSFDEKGNMCPLGKATITISNNSKNGTLTNDMDKEAVFKETCQSDACIQGSLTYIKDTVAYIDAFKELTSTEEFDDKSIEQDVGLLKEMSTYLESKECKNSSDAISTPIRIGSSLLISLGLLLFTFF